jgi:hypothetical protein
MENEKLYPWEDYLGELPAPNVQVNFDGKELRLEENRHGEWIAIARRENGRWVSLFSNLRIEEKGTQLSFVRIA